MEEKVIKNRVRTLDAVANPKRTCLVRLARQIVITVCITLSPCAQSRDLLVITDMEPDDRIALMLLAAEFPTDILSVGTTGLHAGRKQVLAARFLDRVGLAGIPVIQGSGGEAASYPAIASSRAAREYRSEGSGLLPKAELVAINRNMPRSSERLSQAIRDALRRHDDIEIVLLAPATDLVHALVAEPSLQARVRHIHMMAGWLRKTTPSGEVVRRTTYNWNMDPDAGAKLISMKSVPMTLYSSHTIKSSFSGGSINNESFPAVIGELASARCRVPVFESFLIAANSWDHHLMEKIPPLRTIIGDHAGRQFTPADPVVVVGMSRPDFITKARSVDITIDLNDLDPARGFKVTVTTDPASRITLVEAVDREIFRQQLLYALRKIAAASRKPACWPPALGDRRPRSISIQTDVSIEKSTGL
jgi:inosine-uridine nucleoside N-ribohydrolase